MDYTSSYMTILQETLEKKQAVLQAILEACRRQGELTEQEEFDPDIFSSIMDQKDALLAQLTQLDEGFEKTYEGIRSELDQNRSQYAESDPESDRSGSRDPGLGGTEPFEAGSEICRSEERDAAGENIKQGGIYLL